MERRKDNKGKVLKEGESQRKDGLYQYRWTDRTGKRHTVYAGSLKELRDKEQEIQQKLSSGFIPTSEISVYQLTKRHLEETQSTVRPNTYDTKARNLKVIAAHSIADINVTDVLVRDVKQFVRELDKEGYAYATIRNILALSRPAFQEMFDENAIPRNPFVFKLGSVIKDDKKEKEILTEEQYRNLISFMTESTIYKKHLGEVILLHETGMRAGELCGLTTKSFDLENKTVTVSCQMIYDKRAKELHLSKPKTDSGIRVLPLSDEAILGFKMALETRPKLKTERMVDGQVNFLFVTKSGRPLIGKDITGNFDRLINAYNNYHDEPLPEITPHSMRHEYCTRLVRAKMNLKSVQYLMGHSTPEITLKVYTHILKEETEKEAIEEFNRISS